MTQHRPSINRTPGWNWMSCGRLGSAIRAEYQRLRGMMGDVSSWLLFDGQRSSRRTYDRPFLKYRRRNKKWRSQLGGRPSGAVLDCLVPEVPRSLAFISLPSSLARSLRPLLQ